MGWFERGVVLLGRAHERSEASLRRRLRGLIFEPISHAKEQRRKGDRVGECGNWIPFCWSSFWFVSLRLGVLSGSGRANGFGCLTQRSKDAKGTG